MPDGQEPQTPVLEDDGVLTFDYPRLDEKRKVAIVGFATGHAHKAPFADPAVEKWGINQLWKRLPEKHFDRWFELHDLYKFYHANPGHQDFLRRFDGPVYVRAQDYALAREWGIETAQPFPHTVILEQFRPYFNNTVSWLIAMAITMRPEWLGLYGVDMAQDHALLAAEYGEQRPSCEYFIGLAEASGIPVELADGSDLLHASHLYGYESPGPVREKMNTRYREIETMQAEIKGQMGQYEDQMKALQSRFDALEGAKQEDKYWVRNWITPEEKP